MDKKEIVAGSLIYIEKNLKQKISIEEIADYVGYSKFYFSRMFKQEMNISIMEYVKERKVICASESILQGNKILDVAIEYGWESHSGFIKAFKSYYGFSPSLLYAMNLEIIHLGGRNMRNYAFYEKTDEHMSKEDLFELLERKMTESKLDTTELGTVYNFCQKSYANKKRYSGDVKNCIDFIEKKDENSIIGLNTGWNYRGVQWNIMKYKKLRRIPLTLQGKI